ncbi:MAG: hypothetical protein AAGJ96_03120 [Pseudomonadota bacterium]
MSNATHSSQPLTMHEALAAGRKARSDAAHAGIKSIRSFFADLFTGHSAQGARHA